MNGDQEQPLVPFQNVEDFDRQSVCCSTLHSSQEDLKPQLQVLGKGSVRDTSTASDTRDGKEQSGALPHLKTTEGEVKPRESVEEIVPVGHSIFTLSEWGKDSTQKTHLKTRLRDQTGDEPLTYAESMELTDKQSFSAHTDIKLFKCYDCGKTYTRGSSLRVHQRTHAGDRPFECPDCGKKFAQKGSMSAHQRIHTGEKPFACPNCGKRFTIKSNLEVHLRIHTGEKPYKCHLCGKKFSQNISMKRHQRRMLFKCGLNVEQILQKNVL